MKVHAAIARALLLDGHTTLFGLMGDANLFMVEEYVRAGGRFVATAHEAGSVLAANGYASVTDDVAVATVTHGPALTNTVTALVEGVRSRLPVVLLAGDTSPSDPKTLQRIDQQAVVVPTGAAFVDASTGDVVRTVRDAVHRARRERRPVCVNIPVQRQWEDTAPPATQSPAEPADVPVAPGTDGTSEALERAAGVVATARRPVLLAGRGGTSDAARGAVLDLADHLGAPLATTLRAKDLFTGHPRDLGVFGTLSSDATIDAIVRSDCVVALGAALSPSTTDAGGLLEGRPVVHCDVDPARFGEHHAATVAVLGDAAVTARGLLDLLRAVDPTPRPPWNPVAPEDSDGRSRTSDADGEWGVEAAVRLVEECVPAQRTLVVDLGRFAATALKGLHVTHPHRYVHTASFGSIGLGMGNAVGAALARPQEPTLLVCGDGGFVHGGLAELTTAVRYGLDIVVAVMNDGAYNAEHVQFRRRGVDPSLSLFTWPALAPLAQALGGSGVTVRSAADRGRLAVALQHRTGPLLIDLRIPVH